MKTQATLVISSIFASLITLAAAPAMAQTHLVYAADLVDNTLAADNAWGTPCAINWVSYTATTNGACLFTLALRQADPTITTTLLKSWWASTNPGSAAYYDKIVNQVHFTRITDIVNVLPGDLISVMWLPANGHSMIVEDAPIQVLTPFSPLVPDTTQYLVGIIDSASSAHGEDDTRFENEANGLDDQGVGRGVMRLYRDNTNGGIAGYTWSDVMNGTFYTPAMRSVAVGRFVR